MIYMIIYDKAPNNTNGSMGGTARLVGESYPLPSRGWLTLRAITEGFGRNGKPVVVLEFENNHIVEIPDYGIEKYRDYGQEREEADNKTE